MFSALHVNLLLFSCSCVACVHPFLASQPLVISSLSRSCPSRNSSLLRRSALSSRLSFPRLPVPSHLLCEEALPLSTIATTPRPCLPVSPSFTQALLGVWFSPYRVNLTVLPESATSSDLIRSFSDSTTKLDHSRNERASPTCLESVTRNEMKIHATLRVSLVG